MGELLRFGLELWIAGMIECCSGEDGEEECEIMELVFLYEVRPEGFVGRIERWKEFVTHLRVLDMLREAGEVCEVDFDEFGSTVIWRKTGNEFGVR